MQERLSRTQIIDALDKAMRLYVEEGICIDMAEVWDWFYKFTGQRRFSNCSDEILMDLLISWRAHYVTRPATKAQIRQIYDLLEKATQHGVYEDCGQALDDFIGTWQDPQHLTKPNAELAILSLEAMLC